MADTKISAAGDAGVLLSTDMVPLARSGNSTALRATMAEVITYTSALPSTATATTQTAGNSSTALATTAFVQTAVANGVPNDNVVDNSGFAVNQRGYTSGTALASGAFGHDRWKGGDAGCTYTFTQSGGPATTITITAGSLQQVVEGAALSTGSYTLSWTGTAQGRYGGGSYAASPVAVSATVGTNLTIEFNTGTLGQVKLEAGTVRTSWIPAGTPQQILAECQRFYCFLNALGISAYSDTVNRNLVANVVFPVTMRAIPTIAFNTASSGLVQAPATNGVDRAAMSFGVLATGGPGGAYWNGSLTASADL